MKKILLILIMVVLVKLLLAQVPSTISYQGFYTDANGVPVNDNASQSHTVKFDFFRGSETNSAFSRTIQNVKVTKGLFSVIIGRNVTAEDGALNTPLSIDDIHTNASYSVQVTIDGTVIGNKVPLSAVPYAMTAGKVSGSNVTGTIDAVQVVGSGAGITNLNASNLATGTIADARLEPTVDIGALNVGAGGELAISNTGNITKIKGLAYDFPSSHNSGTTFLSNNGSGTLAWSGLPANVPTGSGAANTLALWSGANALSNDTDLFWDGGTNTLTATNFSGNGAGLTSITAANLTGTNTLPATVLPTTVPIGNGATDRVTLWSGTGTVSSSANLTWNGTTNTLSATNFSGNGAALTSLTAANISGTNTLPAGVLPTTVPLGNGATNRLTFWSGTGTVSSHASLTWNGSTLSASNFSGNGSALTSLTAANLTGTNTLPEGVLPTTVPIGNGVTNRLTFWSGTSAVSSSANLTWNGATNTLTSTNFNGNGSGLTSLDGSNISGGTIADARLESTIDRTVFNASDYMTASGGLNVGGSSDPNGNLLVSSGAVVIGSPTLSTFSLDIKSPGSATSAVVRIDKTAAAGSSMVDFYRAGFIVGNISESAGTVSYNSFTGSHIGACDEELEIGTLVTMTGELEHIQSSVESEPVYHVLPSQKANDPKILGAYLHPFDKNGMQTNLIGNINAIMAVGNGLMWVVDNGNDIEVGDYLISSSVKGHAMADDGEFEVAYIVGRAAEAVRWSEVQGRFDGARHKRISVFFENFIIDRRAEKMETEVIELRERISKLENQISKLEKVFSAVSYSSVKP